jgi:hypothetical protein
MELDNENSVNSEEDGEWELDNEVRRELEAEIICERSSSGRRDFLEGPLRIRNDTVVILDDSGWFYLGFEDST